MTTTATTTTTAIGDSSRSTSSPRQPRVLFSALHNTHRQAPLLPPGEAKVLYILLGDDHCDQSGDITPASSSPPSTVDYCSDSSCSASTISSSSSSTNSNNNSSSSSNMMLKRPPLTTAASTGRSSCLVLSALLVLLALVSSAISSDTADGSPSIPMTTLSNGVAFPLVGVGVGNLAHDLIVERIEQAIASDRQSVLIDTAHASKNEALVRTGITNGLHAAPVLPVHVITKVWYTHLGYERTKMAVQEALQELNPNSNANIKVHVLIHWPRCFDEIPWMDCEREENDLPPEVQAAGPPPHMDREGAYLESWRALEDIYTGKINLGQPLASIGVSNFALEDMLELEKHMTVAPHILQGNIWSFLFDPFLVQFCKDNQIHFQAFNVVHGIFYDREFEDAPNAILALNAIAEQVTERASHDMPKNYTLPQIVFKWLVQTDVSVIPRTRSVERLTENAAVTIAQMPTLGELEMDTVKSAVSALLTKEDIEPPLAVFKHAASEDLLMHIFWISGATGEEVPVKRDLKAGELYTAYTQRNHKFAVYYDGTDIRKEFVIHAHHGQHQRFDLVDEKGEEL